MELIDNKSWGSRFKPSHLDKYSGSLFTYLLNSFHDYGKDSFTFEQKGWLQMCSLPDAELPNKSNKLPNTSVCESNCSQTKVFANWSILNMNALKLKLIGWEHHTKFLKSKTYLYVVCKNPLYRYLYTYICIYK